MAAPDSGLTPATTSDHFMAAAVQELRAVVKILGEIKDVLISGTQPKQEQKPDTRTFDVKEPVSRKK